MSEAEPERHGTTPPGAESAQIRDEAEEQRLRWQIRVAAACARRASASRRFGPPFDETVDRVRDELDGSFWTGDEWGSSFDRTDFARTVVALVEGRGRGDLDPRLVTAVLDCLEYTLTTPLAYGPGGADWAEKRCTTFHEDVVAADAVGAIFEARARAFSRLT